MNHPDRAELTSADPVGATTVARRKAALVGVALLVTGCGGGATAEQASDEASGQLIVFAAVSLIDAFDELDDAFGRVEPDVDVVFNFAPSQTLAHQINQGVAADVFASADVVQMDAVEHANNVAGQTAILTTNRLEIAVEPGNPLGIAGLTDLADPDLVLVLPAEQTPAGRYAQHALAAAGVEATPASLERDVRAAVSKVELGEADAAIVYASDIVASAGRADGVAIPDEHNVVASYPVAVLTDAANPRAADAFVAFVLSDAGQQILAAHGFVTP